MSRIGRAPIAIPAGVEIKIEENNVVTVKGPKGTLTRQFHPNMTIAQEGAELKVTRPNDAKEKRALHGLTRTLLHNMVVGVTEGFKKELDVTLVSASSLEKDFSCEGTKTDAAKQVGVNVAERAKAKGIENVVFDRGGYVYHGRVKALAEGAREGGLQF